MKKKWISILFGCFSSGMHETKFVLNLIGCIGEKKCIYFFGVSSSINDKKKDEKTKKKMLVQKLGGLLPNCIAK